MAETATILGPQDHGRRMGLGEFDLAEAREGFVYELGRGVVVVVNVPSPRHGLQVEAARDQFTVYKLSHPGRIHAILGGSDCKVPVPSLESERHPDIAVYTTPPPEEDVWAAWVPDIVVEVVSPGSEDRDYVEKREEYLQFGIKEYWILDSDRGEMFVLRRSGGRWSEKVLKPPEVY